MTSAINTDNTTESNENRTRHDHSNLAPPVAVAFGISIIWLFYVLHFGMLFRFGALTLSIFLLNTGKYVSDYLNGNCFEHITTTNFTSFLWHIFNIHHAWKLYQDSSSTDLCSVHEISPLCQQQLTDNLSKHIHTKKSYEKRKENWCFEHILSLVTRQAILTDKIEQIVLTIGKA